MFVYHLVTLSPYIMTEAIPLLDINGIEKSYTGAPALRGVSLSIPAGAIVCLLGPSGCGKTTLLRVIAGLERADRGVVRFAGQPIDALPAHTRGFGLMFQEYALFPHRDVAANVAFGLRMQGRSRHEIAARVAWAAAGRIGLEFDHLIDAREMLVQLRKGPKGEDRYRAPVAPQRAIGAAQLRLARSWGVTVGLSVPEAVQPRRRRP